MYDKSCERDDCILQKNHSLVVFGTLALNIKCKYCIRCQDDMQLFRPGKWSTWFPGDNVPKQLLFHSLQRKRNFLEMMILNTRKFFKFGSGLSASNISNWFTIYVITHNNKWMVSKNFSAVYESISIHNYSCNVNKHRLITSITYLDYRNNVTPAGFHHLINELFLYSLYFVSQFQIILFVW